MTDKTETIFITCIGIDNKIHVCEPHSKTCKCGVKVKRKKLLKNDYNLYFWCFDCGD